MRMRGNVARSWSTRHLYLRGRTGTRTQVYCLRCTDELWKPQGYLEVKKSTKCHNGPVSVKSIYSSHRRIHCINVIHYYKVNQPQWIKLLTSEWPQMTIFWLLRRAEKDVVKRWPITDTVLTSSVLCLTPLPPSLEGISFERKVVSRFSPSWPLFRRLQRKSLDLTMWLIHPIFPSPCGRHGHSLSVPWY